MKIYNKLFIGTSLCLAVCSCADQGLLPFPGEVQVPDELTQNANLQEYDVLKSYVNRTDNPGFKLGIAVDENDFINKGAAFSIAQTNFDDVTPGNAMKYSSVVKDDGTMDFSTVEAFIETAEEAGLTVYGHTLCWHSQQNLKYLNGLLTPVVVPGDNSNDGGYCLILFNSSVNDYIYGAQTWYELSSPLEEGITYSLSFMAKADKEYKPEIYLQSSTIDENQSYPGGFDVTNEWTKINMNLIPLKDQDKITFNFGTFSGNIYIDNIELKKSGSIENLISNGDFEDANINGWTGWNFGIYEKISENGQGYKSDGNNETTWGASIITNTDFETGISPWNGWGGSATREQSQSGDGYKSNYSFKINNPSKTANSHDVQVAWDFNSPLVKGGTYRLKMMVKGSTAGTLPVSLQRKSDYAGAGTFSNISVGTEWTEYESTVVVSGTGADNADRLLFDIGHYVGTLYIDDVTFCLKEDNSHTEEMPDEKKREVIYAALEKWINNMMEACAGRVKVWDVVNEPISGGNKDLGQVDSEGVFVLQSASNGDPSSNFYWQDYLGHKEFVRDAVRLARKYFAEYGGNPDDLKLFINDYNLESDWDGNGKLHSLIKWIERWEADGVTKIDGIGTQMHVSCSMNENTQKSRENAVENMFKLMRQTGKLIKISEIDMGITYGDEDKKKIMTSDVTLVHLLRMADYYNFIIRKYFEIIPPAQRYGITHWSITDAGDEESAWRQGEPIGLWTKEYERKPAYAGFADGLAGIEKSYLGWASSMGSTTGDETSENAE